MTLFLYIAGEKRDRLKEAVETVVPSESIEVYRTPDSLSLRLKQPKDREAIVVIAPSGKEDFSEIVAISHLFQDIRTIVVVPDQESDTIALAHRLRPRFLSYPESDLSELVAVLQKMLTREDRLAESGMK